MNDQKTYKGFRNKKNKLHSLQVVNMKIYIWMFAMILLAPAVLAQTGLFGDSGTSFLTLGIFILITIFIGDQIFRQMRRKK